MSKEIQHTPGPWFTCEQTKKPHNFALVGIGNGATHVGYASVTPAMTLREADANARLIAAAPELLKELTQFVDRWSKYPKPPRGKELQVYLDNARSAIDKATGG